MKLARKLFPIILFLFLFFSEQALFGINFNHSTSMDETTSNKLEQSKAVEPCEVVTINILKEVLELGDIVVTSKESGSSFPTCRYVWDGGNKNTMNASGNKKEVDIECNVTIVIVDMKVTKSNYDASIKSYPDATEIFAIGDYAVWSDKRKQMTVLVGKNLFHVHVDFVPDNEINRQKAIALSEVIIASF